VTDDELQPALLAMYPHCVSQSKQTPLRLEVVPLSIKRRHCQKHSQQVMQLLPPPHPDADAAMTAETMVGSGRSNSNSNIAGRRRARLIMLVTSSG
jgi:hypothetical protein